MSQSPSYPFDLLIGRKGLQWKGPALLFGTIACTAAIMPFVSQLIFYWAGIRALSIFANLFYIMLECGVCVLAAPKLHMLSKWQLSLFIGSAYSVIVWGISILLIRVPVFLSVSEYFLPAFISTTLFFYLMFIFYRGGKYACIAAALVFLFSEFAEIVLRWFFESFPFNYDAYTGKQFLFIVKSKFLAAAVFALSFFVLQKVLKVQTGTAQVNYSFTPGKRGWYEIVLAVIMIIIGLNSSEFPQIISLPILSANQIGAIGFGFLLFVIYKSVKCNYPGSINETTEVNVSSVMPVQVADRIGSNNASDCSYMEMDNLGSRQDTFDKAKTYWISQNVNQKSDPFVLYTFNKLGDAEAALLELSFIHRAVDTGNLICRETLNFGCYETPDGTIEAVLSGNDLSSENWDAARISFADHGGVKKNEKAPVRMALCGHPHADTSC